MPKVYLNREQEMDEALRKNAGGRLGRLGKTSCTDAAKIIHCSSPTWLNRMKNPGQFRLDELRILFDKTGFTNEEILQVFGRKSENARKIV